MNEKATALVETTKTLHDSIADRSKEEITDLLTRVVDAYNALNKEINYYSEN